MRISRWEPGVEARVTETPRIQTWEDRGGEVVLVAFRCAPRMPTMRCLAAFTLLLTGLLLPRDLLGGVKGRHCPGLFPSNHEVQILQAALYRPRRTNVLRTHFPVQDRVDHAFHLPEILQSHMMRFS